MKDKYKLILWSLIPIASIIMIVLGATIVHDGLIVLGICGYVVSQFLCSTGGSTGAL